MPLQSTTGTASYDGFGGSATAAPVYIEDVFSTYLYTGNGSTQTITNGIDLAGKGGMVWVKSRSDSLNNLIGGPDLGTGKTLIANSSLAALSNAQYWPAFNSNGFGIGTDTTWSTAEATFVSWTFRKAPKFFDVVTWTGTNTLNRAITHSLGITPGMIVFKRTDAAEDWWVIHRSGTNGFDSWGILNSTTPFTPTGSGISSVNSSTFTLDPTSLYYNQTGKTYAAYLFAHDAGGFGLSGTDNVISCGSYVGTGNTAGLGGLLGWEPQWLLIKNTTSTADWVVLDNLRGMSLVTSSILAANTNASQTVSPRAYPYQYGFNLPSSNISVNESGSTYIYIAIRRGPMRRPTSGTSVYSADLTSAATKITTGFPVDFQLFDQTTAVAGLPRMTSRLTGFQYRVAATAVEQSVGLGSNPTTWDNTGFTPVSATANSIFHSFRRAPGFFDTVIYGGNGTTQTVPHGLGVPPELIIFRYRNAAVNTSVMSIHINNNNTSWTSDQQLLFLNLPDAKVGVGPDWLGNNTSFIAPTAAAFTIGSNGLINQSGGGYTAFLFASVPGVSKIGSYTGNGTTQTVDCGFTAGARFVLIKRLSSTNHWRVFDTARGIVAGGNDPFNNFIENEADNSSEDCIDPVNSGFIVKQTGVAQLNENANTYLYFAVA
jgi:hypothetical protein